MCPIVEPQLSPAQGHATSTAETSQAETEAVAEVAEVAGAGVVKASRSAEAAKHRSVCAAALVKHGKKQQKPSPPYLTQQQEEQTSFVSKPESEPKQEQPQQLSPLQQWQLCQQPLPRAAAQARLSPENKVMATGPLPQMQPAVMHQRLPWHDPPLHSIHSESQSGNERQPVNRQKVNQQQLSIISPAHQSPPLLLLPPPPPQQQLQHYQYAGQQAASKSSLPVQVLSTYGGGAEAGASASRRKTPKQQNSDLINLQQQQRVLVQQSEQITCNIAAQKMNLKQHGVNMMPPALYHYVGAQLPILIRPKLQGQAAQPMQAQRQQQQQGRGHQQEPPTTFVQNVNVTTGVTIETEMGSAVGSSATSVVSATSADSAHAGGAGVAAAASKSPVEERHHQRQISNTDTVSNKCPYITCDKCTITMSVVSSGVETQNFRVAQADKAYFVPNACEVCGINLTDGDSKQQSSDLVPKGRSFDKKFTCKICNISYKRLDRLLAHAFIHTGRKPFLCQVCNRRFSRRDHLSVHRANKHPTAATEHRGPIK